MKLHWIAVLALLGTNYGAQSKNNADTVSLSPQEQTVSAGYFTLRYNDLSSISNPMLQVAQNPSFDPLLRAYPIGGTEQISLSGFSNGDYYFRVHEPSSKQFSRAAKVKVEHHSLELASSLFSTGLMLFLFLVGLVTYYSHKNNKAE